MARSDPRNSSLQRLGGSVDDRHSATPYVRRNALVDQRLARLAYLTHDALESSQSLMTRDTHLIELYAYLANQHGDGVRPPPPVSSAGQRIRRALQMMHERFAENVTIDDLAKAAGLSPFHFIRTFRRELGMPPHGYLTRYACAMPAAG